MQQKSAGETISQQVVHQPRRFSRPFFLRMAVSCELADAERVGFGSMRLGFGSSVFLVGLVVFFRPVPGRRAVPCNW